MTVSTFTIKDIYIYFVQLEKPARIVERDMELLWLWLTEIGNNNINLWTIFTPRECNQNDQYSLTVDNVWKTTSLMYLIRGADFKRLDEDVVDRGHCRQQVILQADYQTLWGHNMLEDSFTKFILDG